MRRILAWLVLSLMLMVSCAVPVPPSGGPEDTEPPRIVSVLPDSAAAGVDRNTSITIEFSEKMNRSRVERLVSTYPPFEIGNVSWNKNSITIQPASPLVADTTYLLVIEAGYRDAHNVSSTGKYSSVFATADRVDEGTISGTVLFRREPTNKAVVRCFVLRTDSVIEPRLARPDREVTTGDRGMFSFSYLPTDGTRFLVWAFQDQNGNNYFEPGNEFGQLLGDTILLTEESPAAGKNTITIIDPTEPGEISGVVMNQTGADTILVAVTLTARTDTVETIAHLGVTDPSGGFRFQKVAPGTYMLRAFIDYARDSVCGSYRCFDDTTRFCTEPCVQYPDSIALPPGGTVQLDTLLLRKGGGDDRND